ncbi:uncharacterized protein LOC131004083 [Salvia miltiorrhiza]|uniref:uncharacterized protein LOC131004083 n=1 Tax=Salvia miltiorrhiza TaxID=226208 RepID=UPI0025ACD392|nr:uncharacterized protein LOC131004083 [Salvia miltiorrhiza]
MIRQANTRFATAFLTLRSFQLQKQNLNNMFSSEKWNKSKFAKKKQAMNRAKEQTTVAFSHVEDIYKDFYDIIDKRWDVQLHQPLHATDYFLNPEFFYNDPDEMAQVVEDIEGFYDSITKLTNSNGIEDEILKELVIYKKVDEIFSIPAAKMERTLISLAEWWGLYGASTPNLQKLAIKILSLTCSSSGCERN